MKSFFSKSILLNLVFIVGILAGCQAATTSESTGEIIVIGTGNGYQPFVYLDENNELQGYDIEVLKAIDEKLPDYQFQYEAQDFKNILTSLSAGKIRIAAHQYAYNEERGAKYLYGEVGYNTYALHIVNDSANGPAFQSLEELHGKRVFASPGSEAARILESYNQDNQEAIEIIYNEGSSELLVKGLQNGTADATILTKYDTNKYNQQFQAELQRSETPVSSSQTYFIFQKEDEELQASVDQALQELIDEGKLAELSVEILGDDYTK